MPPNLGKDWEVVETGKKPHRHKLPKPGDQDITQDTVIMCKECQVCYMKVYTFNDGFHWRPVNRVENGWR